MKKNKGNILLIFIMLVGVSFIIFTITNIVTTNLRQSRIKMSETCAFYAAEAGLNKATWYLATHPDDGGKGKEWRGSTSEAYGPGVFEVTVFDSETTYEVILISTGEVAEISRTIIQTVDTQTFPHAFDYAIFSGNSDVAPIGIVVISGDLYANGNIDLHGASEVIDGKVYYPEGYTVSGNAEDGGVLDPPPTMPDLDTSFYDDEISIAEAVATGNQSYVNIDLTGGDIYVNGDISITGTGDITGPGVIVATGKITITGNPVGNNEEIIFISAGEIEIAGGPELPTATFYSRDDFSSTGALEVNVGTILTSGDVVFGGTADFSGIIYATGAAILLGDTNITGSLVVNSVEKVTGTVNITYDEDLVPTTPPTGLETGDPEPVKGTWQEI